MIAKKWFDENASNFLVVEPKLKILQRDMIKLYRR